MTLRARLASHRIFAEALEREADLQSFRRRPSGRLVVGLVLVGISYPMGWPAMAAWSAVAVWMHHPNWALWGAPSLYVLSWGVWAVGIWIAGPAGVAHLRDLKHFSLRWFATRFLMP